MTDAEIDRRTEMFNDKVVSPHVELIDETYGEDVGTNIGAVSDEVDGYFCSKIYTKQGVVRLTTRYDTETLEVIAHDFEE